MGSRLCVKRMAVHFPGWSCCGIPSVAGYQDLSGGSVSWRCLWFHEEGCRQQKDGFWCRGRGFCLCRLCRWGKKGDIALCLAAHRRGLGVDWRSCRRRLVAGDFGEMRRTKQVAILYYPCRTFFKIEWNDRLCQRLYGNRGGQRLSGLISRGCQQCLEPFLSVAICSSGVAWICVGSL